MFHLKIDGKSLELGQDSTITLVQSCPIFDQDGLDRAFSFPFRLPHTPENLAILGHRNRFDHRDRAGLLENASLFVGGSFFRKGELAIIGSTDFWTEVVFRVAPIGVLETLKGFRINEILPTISVGFQGNGGHLTYEMLFFPTTYSIGFGPNGALATYTPAPGESLSFATMNFLSAINAAVPGITLGGSNGFVTLSPNVVNQFPVLNVGNLALSSFESEAENDHAAMKNHVQSVAAAPIETHCFPLINWIDFYAEKNPPVGVSIDTWKEMMNPVINGQLLENEPTDGPIFRYSALPCVRLPFIFEKIIEKLGLGEMAGSWWDEADVQQLIVVSNYDLAALRQDRFMVGNDSSDTFEWRQSYRQDIDLNDHVPEMTAAEFVEAMIEGFKLWMDVRGGRLLLSPKKAMIEQAPVDWTEYVEPDVSRKLVERKGFSLRLARNKDERYQSSPDQLANYESSPAKRVEELKFSTLQMRVGTVGNLSAVHRVPYTRQKGVSDAYSFEKKAYALQLLFDRGARTIPGAQSYIYASSDDIGINDAAQLGAMSLQWAGVNGLYNRWHRGIQELNDAPEVTFDAVLPIETFRNLSGWANARVRVAHPDGTMTIVLKTIQAQLRADAPADLIRCRIEGVIQ